MSKEETTPYCEFGNVTLYHGDCLDIMPKLNIKFDACVTDIPYFSVIEEQWDNQWGNMEDYYAWCRKVVESIGLLMKPDSSLLMFTSRQHNRKICGVLDDHMTEKRIIIWVRKRSFNNTRGNALSSGYEPICYYSIGKPAFNCIKIKINSARKEYKSGCLKDGICLSDVWNDIPSLPHNSKEKIKHPTQKPLVLMQRCVEMVTIQDGMVIDPFAGSGTTGIACMNLNRKCVLIEKDESYCEMIKNRIENHVVQTELEL